MVVKLAIKAREKIRGSENLIKRMVIYPVPAKRAILSYELVDTLVSNLIMALFIPYFVPEILISAAIL
jgi:hypothetical protein